jgi:hypothetical protein
MQPILIEESGTWLSVCSGHGTVDVYKRLARVGVGDSLDQHVGFPHLVHQMPAMLQSFGRNPILL